MRTRLRVLALAALVVGGVYIAACAAHTAHATHTPVAQVGIVGIKASNYVSLAQHAAKTLEQGNILPTDKALAVQQALRDASATALQDLVPLLRDIDATVDEVAKAQKLDKARVLARHLITEAATVYPQLSDNPAFQALSTLIDQIVSTASGLVDQVTASIGT